MNKMIHTAFSDMLKSLRKQRKLTQQELAVRLGVHRNTIGFWERGDYLPESKTIVLELAHILKLDTHETQHLLEASLTAPANYWSVPYQRYPLFTARETLLDKLHQVLSPQLATDEWRACTLCGLGGMGKTVAAIEYAYRYAQDYSAVFWVDAETQETLLASVLSIAECLNLLEKPEANQPQTTAVLRWLHQHGDWLVIFDNVEDIGLVQEFLPVARRGSLIFTTRIQASGLLTQSFEIKPMAAEEGLDLLLRRARQFTQDGTLISPAERAAAKGLVEILGGLPLALDQAGAYIEETASSLSDYIKHYQTDKSRLLYRRGRGYSGHPASVGATLELCIEHVEQINAAAVDVLYICAFLDAEAIPEEIITTDGYQLEIPLRTLARDAYEFDAIMAMLRDFSLLHRQVENKTLSIHRLVQDVLKTRLDEEACRSWAARVIRHMNTCLSNILNTANGAECWRYWPHVLECVRLIKRWKLCSPEAAQLLYQGGVLCYIQSLYVQAEDFFTTAQEMYLLLLGSDNIEVYRCLNMLGAIAQKQGKYTQSEVFWDNSLSIKER